MDYEQMIADLNQLLNEFKLTVIEFIPRFLFAIVIFLFGLVIARLLKALVSRFILNLPKLTPNEKFRSKLRQVRLERSAKLVGRIVFWIVLFIFLTIATEILNLPIVTAWLAGIVKYLPNILIAILIIFTGLIGGRIVGDLIVTAASSAGVSYSKILGKLIHYTIVFITIMIGIDQVGVDIAFLTHLVLIVIAALLFGGALAFGIGARTSVSNILAAYYLHNIYKVGNIVRIREIEGKIIQITPTTVILDTAQGQVSVPAREFSETVSTLVRKE